ncbi:hypothetical protein [Plasmodium yoelii yoelii]|uniref:Uncharacterized protein n=1 Tax=Plasmodium yoelii yoelii TaxID=73239 RepID=Q7R9A2_PLAYO|nr:hypothetical protein [Plasmodium yoelii yoelii]
MIQGSDLKKKQTKAIRREMSQLNSYI